jgi:HSP20 family protein
MSDKKQNDSGRSDDIKANLPLGGLLDGVANIIGRLGDLAEKGEALRREGNFDSANAKELRGSYGFSVSLGKGGSKDETQHEVKPHRSTSKQEDACEHPTTRQPLIEIFEENDCVLVIAEMPGVSVENVKLQFEFNKLLVSGKSARLNFEASVDLPCQCNAEDVSVTENNGLVEIKLNRKH